MPRGREGTGREREDQNTRSDVRGHASTLLDADPIPAGLRLQAPKHNPDAGSSGPTQDRNGRI